MKIKFNKAIESMNPGDVFSPYSSDHAEFIMNKNGSFKGSTCDNPKELVLTKKMLLLEGEIIPAEPKVLSAEELTKNHGWMFTTDMRQILEAARTNYRLERDLELRPLVDWCEENYMGAGQELFSILKNLKPLTETDDN